MTKKILSIFVAILLATTCLLVIPSAKAEPDYEYNYDLPADGSEDSSDDYVVVRDDSGASASVSVKAWESNKTIRVDMINIKEVEINFTEMNIDFEKYINLFATSTTIDIIVSSDDVGDIDFTLRGIPEFVEAEVDESSWDAYTYYPTNRTMTFDMDMSEHVISLTYDGWMNEIFSLVVSVMILVVVVKIIKKGLIDEVK